MTTDHLRPSYQIHLERDCECPQWPSCVGHRGGPDTCDPHEHRGPVADTARLGTAPCWFCKQTFVVDALIAGYDTFDEQRLACLACNERMKGDWKLDTTKSPKLTRIDWSNVVVDEGDEAP